MAIYLSISAVALLANSLIVHHILYRLLARHTLRVHAYVNYNRMARCISPSAPIYWYGSVYNPNSFQATHNKAPILPGRHHSPRNDGISANCHSPAED